MPANGFYLLAGDDYFGRPGHSSSRDAAVTGLLDDGGLQISNGSIVVDSVGSPTTHVSKADHRAT